MQGFQSFFRFSFTSFVFAKLATSSIGVKLHRFSQRWEWHFHSGVLSRDQHSPPCPGELACHRTHLGRGNVTPLPNGIVKATIQ